MSKPGARAPGLVAALALTVVFGTLVAERPIEAVQSADSSPAAASDALGELQVGPGDVLSIDVFGLDELDLKVRVRAGGTISMPHLGEVEVAGLDAPAVAERLERLLAERQLVNDPQVTVFVEEFSSRSVSVQGAVENPGVYQLLARSRLLDVIGMAGGLSGTEERRVILLRQEDGEDRRIEVDLARLIDAGELSLNLQLRPGDVVIIPRERKVRVYVTGAVERPGAVEYSSGEGISVLQAITAAGGPTERANLGRVTIRRASDEGEQELLRVNVRRIQKDLNQDVALQPNDTVVVGEWVF